MIVDSGYEELLENLLESAGPTLRADKKYCMFSPLHGRQWHHDVMFYGRALNDWGEEAQFEGWKTGSAEGRKGIANAVIAVSNGSAPVCKQDREAFLNDPACDFDPMHWVHHLRQREKRFRCTASGSPYWRVVGKVVCSRGNISPSSTWAARLAWSNLYKLALCGGRPSAPLKAAQFEACLRLMQRELSFYKPRAVVFLTENRPGREPWFRPFRERLGSSEFRTEQERLVLASCVLRVDEAECVAVIAEHPQGRPESCEASLIIEVLNRRAPA
jgi:hypothetical protein